MNNYKCTDKTIPYKYEVEELLQKKKKEILNFFETKDNGTFNFNIYIYDNLNDLHNGLKKRGFISNELSCQINKDNSLNFIKPDDKLKKEYEKNIFYEEIRGIEHLIYGIHPKWLKDGIIMCIDNTIDIKTIIENTEINEFEEPYCSYIIVSYLIEKYNKNVFLTLIALNNFIKEIENSNMICEAIKYYLLKYNIKCYTKKSVNKCKIRKNKRIF
jgi:hypothetical protein